MDLTLQIAGPEDTEALANLVNSAYRGDSSRAGWTTEADLLGGQRTDAATLREMMRQPENRFLLFKQGSELVGSVFLQRRSDHAYLGMFTVRPVLQARGIGRTALAAAEAWVMENWGVNRVEMTVIGRRHELIAWYLRRGYADTGRREPFPIEDANVGAPKVDDLTMLVLAKEPIGPSH